MAVIILTILYVPFKYILGKQNLHWGRNTYRNKANWLVRWRLREREGEGKGKEEILSLPAAGPRMPGPAECPAGTATNPEENDVKILPLSPEKNIHVLKYKAPMDVILRILLNGRAAASPCFL